MRGWYSQNSFFCLRWSDSWLLPPWTKISKWTYCTNWPASQIPLHACTCNDSWAGAVQEVHNQSGHTEVVTGPIDTVQRSTYFILDTYRMNLDHHRVIQSQNPFCHLKCSDSGWWLQTHPKPKWTHWSCYWTKWHQSKVTLLHIGYMEGENEPSQGNEKSESILSSQMQWFWMKPSIMSKCKVNSLKLLLAQLTLFKGQLTSHWIHRGWKEDITGWYRVRNHFVTSYAVILDDAILDVQNQSGHIEVVTGPNNTFQWSPYFILDT